MLITTLGFLAAAAGLAAPPPVILAPADLAPFDQFGQSVASSGNIMVVGAPGAGSPFSQSTGSVYVYQRNESTWTQQARLTVPFGLPGDAFGTSVAIDGNTIVVGAPGDGTSGRAYIFVNVNGVWTRQRDILQATDHFLFGNFGAAVSISKDTIAIGAPFTRQGAVYMFAFSPASGFWESQGKLVPNDANGRSFGASASLVGNTVAIGANSSNGFTGSAYIFGRLNNVWSQTAILAPIQLAGNFGFSTSMSGNTVVVGAPDSQTTGAAFVFTQDNGVWTQQARLPGNGLAGYSVSLNGNTLAAGAPDDSSDKPFEGSVNVYTGGGSNWQLSSQLAPTGGVASQVFGYSTTVIDGNTTAAGSPFVGTASAQRTGVVYVMQR